MTGKETDRRLLSIAPARGPSPAKAFGKPRTHWNAILLACIFAGAVAPALAAPPPGTTEADITVQAGDLTHPFVSFSENDFAAGTYSHSLARGTGSATSNISALDAPIPHIASSVTVTSGPPGSLGFGNASANGFMDYSFVISGPGDTLVTLAASGSIGFSTPQTFGRGSDNLNFRVSEAIGGGIVYDQSLFLDTRQGACFTSFNVPVPACSQSFALSADFLLHTNTVYAVHLDTLASMFSGSLQGTDTAFANLDPTFTVHGPYTIQMSDGFGGGINLSDVKAGVPEPTTWGLMLLGFAGVGGLLRRRTRLSWLTRNPRPVHYQMP